MLADSATAKTVEPSKKSPLDSLKNFFCGIFGSVKSFLAFILSIFTKPFSGGEKQAAVTKGEAQFFTIPSIPIAQPKATAAAKPSPSPIPKIEPSATNKELIARKYAEDKLKEIEKATSTVKSLRSPKDDVGRWPPYVEPPAPRKKSVSSLTEADLKGKR